MKKIAFLFAVLLAFSASAIAAQFEITGKIIDEKKQAISKAKVAVSKSKTSVMTNADGYFKINLKDSTAKLTISKSGYQTINIDVLPYLREHYLLVMEKASASRKPPKKPKGRGGVDLGGYGGETEFASMPGMAGLTAKTASLTVGSEMYISEEGQAGKLTAGDINDFTKWKMWNDISESQLAEYAQAWAVKPSDRFTVQVETRSKSPIVNAKVKLIGKSVIWESRTDNTGKAELWANAYGREINLQEALKIEVEYRGKKHIISNPTLFYEGLNVLQLDEACGYSNNLDMAFVVDATGSMGDEIEYLKSEIVDIINRVKDSVPNVNVRSSALFYRDIGDEYLTKHFDFSDNLEELLDFIKSNSASGGGDFPEAVDAAIQEAVDMLSWRDDALARILFLVLDAPPHQNENSNNTLKKYIKYASAKGIRIVPLTCSGIDKSTEYLMRTFSLLTNGVYLFLTDDSGIGGKHIEPTTDNYSVQLLNSLLFKTIYQFTYLPECVQQPSGSSNTLLVALSDSATAIKGILPSDEVPYQDDSNLGDAPWWKYFPNPSTGFINIELSGKIEELFICDISGKIIFRVENSNQKSLRVDLSDLPNGIYFIKYEYEPEKWLVGKFILSR